MTLITDLHPDLIPPEHDSPVPNDAIDSSLDESIEETSRRLQLARWGLGHRVIPINQRFRQSMMVLALIATALYLTYRLLWTLNMTSPYAMAASIALYAAECWGAMLLSLYFFQVWRLVEPPVKPPLQGRTIDVFVPTYNEDPALLRGTLTACIEMEYPHNTYVLDDGNREEVRELAESLGVHYIARQDHSHAKAGNLNHALKQTDGEFIVILDADHVPLRHYLTRLIGYFDDPQMGFVQAPHTTYNFDNVVGSWDTRSRSYWEDVHLFYNAVQLGKNYWNAATFCGSAAMFRRQSLEEVGLIATETITEDLHTGLRIAARGWKSLAVSEQLISGLAPEDIKAYNSQRLRWGEGNMSVMAFDNPLTMRGLTFSQRINYLAAVCNWTAGPSRLILYLTPILMLLTGVAPLRGVGWTYVLILVLYLGSIWTALKVASNGCANLFAIELSMMSSFYIQTKAVFRALFMRRFARFVVTKKKKEAEDSVLRHILPQISIGLLGIVAIFWDGMNLFLGLSNNYLGFYIGTALVLINGYMAALVVGNGARQMNRRRDWHHPARLFVSLKRPDMIPSDLSTHAITVDFNEKSLTIMSREALEVGEQLQVTIDSPVRNVTCSARVSESNQIGSHRTPMSFGRFYRLEFVDMTNEQTDAIWAIALQFVVPGVILRHQASSQWFINWKGFNRPGRRNWNERSATIPLPMIVASIDDVYGGKNVVVNHLNTDFIYANMDVGLIEGSWVNIKLETPIGPINGSIKVNSCHATRIGATLVYRHRLTVSSLEPENQQKLAQLIDESRKNDWTKAIEEIEPKAPSSYHRPTVNRIAAYTGGFLAASVIAFFVMFQNDLMLHTIAEFKQTSPMAVSQFDSIYDSTSQKRHVSTSRWVRIYNAANQLGKDVDAAHAALILADRVPDESTKWSYIAALHYVKANQNQDAEKIFDKILATGGDLEFDAERRYELYVESARNAVKLNKPHDAANRYLKAMNTNAAAGPKMIDEFASSLLAIGHPEEALRLLEQQDELNEDGLRLEAELYAEVGRIDAAIAIYQRLLKLYPSDPFLIKRLADLSASQKDFVAQVGYLQQLTPQFPGDKQLAEQLRGAMLNAARQYVNQGDDQRALYYFAYLAAHDPDDETKREYANALIRTGDIDRAIPLLAGIKQDPQSQMEIIGLLESQGRFHATIPLFRSLYEQYPDDPVLLSRYAGALEAADVDIDLALTILQQLRKEVRLNQSDAKRLIRLLARTGHLAEAMQMLNNYFPGEPDTPDLRRVYLSVAATMEHSDPAMKPIVESIARKTIEDTYDDMELKDFEAMSDALRRQNLLPIAVTICDAGLLKYPKSSYLLLRRAETLHQLGRYTEAERDFTQLLRDRKQLLSANTDVMQQP